MRSTRAPREKYRNLDGFVKRIEPEDLRRDFSLSPSDHEVVEAKRGSANRLGFALRLCALRYFGFIPEPITEAPPEVVAYVARQIDLPPEVLARYGTREQTRTAHFRDIIAHLGYRKLEPRDRGPLRNWLRDRALEHDRPDTLYSLLREHLHGRKIVRPGLTVVQRFIGTAREEAETATWKAVSALLNPELRERLDALIKVDSEAAHSPLVDFRTVAVKAKPKEILATLGKIQKLRDFGVPEWDMSAFNPNRLKTLAKFARTSDSQMLRRLADSRKYPTLVAFLWETLADRIDEAIDLYDRCLRDLARRAEKELQEFRRSVAEATNEKVKLFHLVGKILLDPDVSDADLRLKIFTAIPPDKFRSAVDDCARIERPLDDTHIDFLGQRYGYLHQFTNQFLDAFTWRAAPGAEPLVAAVNLLKDNWAKGKRGFAEDPPTAFIPEKWRPFVIGENGHVGKRFYELCALWELRAALRAGTVWVTGSRRYADPTGYLIPKVRWVQMREEAARLIEAPLAPKDRIEARIAELETAAATLDELLEGKRGVALDRDDRLILTPLDPDERPDSVAVVEAMVTDRLPRIALPTLLIEVDRLTGFSRHLPHTGNRRRRKEGEMVALYAALLAQSGNFGIARMREMSGLSEDVIEWASRWYLGEEGLDDANLELINFHHHLPLVSQWGGGTFSSSDGQRFPVAVKSLSAVPLPRDFGMKRGLSVYTWTSDQHSQFGTKVIPATVSEATIVLDGLLDNESELSILEHTTDTGGVTDGIFGLFDLLGMRFSPRIKDIGSQRLYRLGDIKGNRVKAIMRHKINRPLIERGWDDLLRLAATVKTGWAPASLMLTKLQSAPKRSPLISSLREYGRLAKTVFILRYLGSPEYRRRIQRQLNKGEALHALRQYLFCANEGKIRKHSIEDQLNQATCLTIVTNAVVIWNTVYIQAAIEQIRREGFLIDDDILQYLSPVRFEHINVFGDYSFPVKEEMRRRVLRPLRNPSLTDGKTKR